jgi:hypothetical protein
MRWGGIAAKNAKDTKKIRKYKGRVLNPPSCPSRVRNFERADNFSIEVI